MSERFFSIEVRVLLWEACRLEGSQVAFARKHGISKQYLSDHLHGRRLPGDKVLKALGLRRIVEYEREDD